MVFFSSMNDSVIFDETLLNTAITSEPLILHKDGFIRDKFGRFFGGKPQDTNKNGTAGRPPTDEEQKVQKLREAFLMGCDDLEACLYADISRSWLYVYQEAHPEFKDQKEVWKETPALEARRTLLSMLPFDADLALKYMERKKKKEFSVRQEITGADGESIEATIKMLDGTAPKTDYGNAADWAKNQLPKGINE